MGTNPQYEESMWVEYARNPNTDNRNKIILYYMDIVKMVALHLYKYFYNSIEFDDLVGYGIFGLVDAINRFDSTKGTKFSSYAYIRIRGTILDYMRDTDWFRIYTNKKNKCPKRISWENSLYKEKTIAQNITPEEYAIKRERLLLIIDAIKKLTPRQQKLIIAHYFKNRKIKDLCKDIGASEMYASAIHRTALNKLARILKNDWKLFLN